MKLRDLLRLGKTPAKTAGGAAKAPSRAAAKGLRNALRRPPSTTDEETTIKAQERTADRAILLALEEDAKGPPARKP